MSTPHSKRECELKMSPCTNPRDGGLIECSVHSEFSVCYPPWNMEKAQKYHDEKYPVKQDKVGDWNTVLDGMSKDMEEEKRGYCNKHGLYFGRCLQCQGWMPTKYGTDDVSEEAPRYECSNCKTGYVRETPCGDRRCRDLEKVPIARLVSSPSNKDWQTTEREAFKEWFLDNSIIVHNEDGSFSAIKHKQTADYFIDRIATAREEAKEELVDSINKILISRYD